MTAGATAPGLFGAALLIAQRPQELLHWTELLHQGKSWQ